MTFQDKETPYTLLTSSDPLPLVIDSPHSGTILPVDIQTAVSGRDLEQHWDAYVDELFSEAAAVGASLLCANYHSCYIDLNRSSTDIDMALLAPLAQNERNTLKSAPTAKSIIRRFVHGNVPIYDRLLSFGEVSHRIASAYQPYHTTLERLLSDSVRRHGTVFHISCHSMRSMGEPPSVDAGKARPDIVVSDCAGTSCDHRLVEWACDSLSKLGFTVSLNDPFKGGYITQHYGLPGKGRHSIQLEVNRKLYMNELTCEKLETFDSVRRKLEQFINDATFAVNALKR